MFPSLNGIRSGVIFISYRRSDSQDVAGRLYEKLVDRFEPEAVFKDVDCIPGGADFTEMMQSSLKTSSVVLAVIGPEWLGAAGPDGKRRLDDPRDYVRTEIETALKLNIPVIPVLVRNATMPSVVELPDGLKPLVGRNWLTLRSDPDFNHDMSRLISSIEHFTSRNLQNELPPILSFGGVRRRLSIVALGLIPMVAMALWIAFSPSNRAIPGTDPQQLPTPPATNGLSFSGSDSSPIKRDPDLENAAVPDVVLELGLDMPPETANPLPTNESDQSRLVSYKYERRNGVLYVWYQLPYLANQREGKVIEGVPALEILRPFDWKTPALSVKVLNNSKASIMLTECIAEVSASHVDEAPVLVVASGVVNALFFANEGWGEVVDPVLTFMISPIKDRVEGVALNGERQTIELKTFDKQCRVPLLSYVPKTLEDEPAVTVSGELAFGPANDRRKVSFLTIMTFEIEYGTPIPPSYSYDLKLIAGTAPISVSVPVSQKVTSGEGDQFLLRIASDKSAQYEMNLLFKLIDGRTLPVQKVVLDVFVPRGMAGRAVKASPAEGPPQQ